MADRRKKVIWTEHEEDKLFDALSRAYKADPSLKKSTKRAAELAQIALPEGRRRNVQSPLHWPQRLRARLVAAGFITSEMVKPEEIDKNILRINQLADERDQAIKERDELLEQNKGLAQQVVEFRKALQSVPSEAQVLKTFVADILWDVESRKRAVPGATSSQIEELVRKKVEAPPERRQLPREPEPEGRSRKVKIAVVGGDHQHSWLQQELAEEHLDLRLFPTRDMNSNSIADRLKAFKEPTYGKVIVWSNYTSHQAPAGLKYQNIPFEFYNGERGGLASKIKQLVQVKEGSTSG